RKATITVFDTNPKGEWNSGDKFFLFEDHLVGRQPNEVVLTLNFTFTWSDTAYPNPERPNELLPPNIPWAIGDTLKIPIFVPFQEGDGFIVRTEQIYEVEESKEEDINKVRVVPNPYIVSAEWEFDEFNRKLQFQNLPSKCTIYIFNVAGELVHTLYHDNIFDG
ncbi:MAG: hypothetical protein GWN00_15160, partial [Aliifodinibius sp.]|nr:hypothetical protein [Fodinibius sp.]NIV12428.1 hypothetical protein [Fodinibius sp.]NIY26092.1 hypothetical protein [Fodinibius sp.]